jgi:G:T-mismatch repair DNA endonuclease (very short patch repair protein)
MSFLNGSIPWNRGKTTVERIRKTCPVCSQTFIVPLYHNRQKFCSTVCMHKVPWNSGKKCPQLSNALKERKSWNKGLTKSTDSRVAKYASKLKGIEKPSLLGSNNPSRRPYVREKLRALNLGERNPMYGKRLTIWHRNALISANLEKRKNKEFSMAWNKKISISMKNKVKTASHRDKLREARLKQNFPKIDTRIETNLQNALKRESIDFEVHKPILNVCQPDLFIRPNICIFCDGDWWHANPCLYERNNLKSKIQIYNVRKDERQNKILMQNNYIILRFWENEILNNIEACVNKIKEATGVKK